MERWGLVAQLEADLERRISLGLLPEDGRLPSEQTLASKYGVSRATAREAVVRLHARDLVELNPGRRARAVDMEETVRLENLGTALLGEGASRPERRRMLEGYLELRREVTVELLVACCEKASEQELDRVKTACFLLEDAVCWERQRPRWAALEFELLRQAAQAAQRPGHFLLIQSLERAWRGMAGRVVPYLDSPALYRWTKCAMEALERRDVQALRTRLPLLLQESDERVLGMLAPTCEANGVFSLVDAEREEPELEDSAEPHPAMTQAPELREPSEADGTVAQAPEPREPAEAHHTASQALELRELAEEHRTAPLTPEVGELAEKYRTAPLAPKVSKPAEALFTAPPVLAVGQPAQASLISAQAPEVGTSAPEPAGAGGPGVLCANQSGCRITLREAPPGGSPPAPVPAAPGSTPCTCALGLHSVEEDSWPWPAHGSAPALT
jgi:GntR family transcriptional regulator, transcriptional repressor for pyruvate dehydrogenase complex